jgi:hypothetical protein
MLNHLSLTQAFLATLRPSGSFEITFYKYLIKFLAKGHSSHQSMRKRHSFSSPCYESFSRRNKWSVILIAIERTSGIRT